MCSGGRGTIQLRADPKDTQTTAPGLHHVIDATRGRPPRPFRNVDAPPAAVRPPPSPPCSVYQSLSIVPVGALTPRPRRARVEDGLARRHAGAGVRAAGIPGTFGGDDAAAGNQPAHLPRRAGPSRPVARARGRVRARAARAQGRGRAAGRRSGRCQSEAHPARLDLGRSHAPGVCH
jgi:hypothetical protein